MLDTGERDAWQLVRLGRAVTGKPVTLTIADCACETRRIQLHRFYQRAGTCQLRNRLPDARCAVCASAREGNLALIVRGCLLTFATAGPRTHSKLRGVRCCRYCSFSSAASHSSPPPLHRLALEATKNSGKPAAPRLCSAP
jgi:hypothetical protein